jgi:pimeloyl-ACP methyl ester carboxylesterase
MTEQTSVNTRSDVPRPGCRSSGPDARRGARSSGPEGRRGVRSAGPVVVRGGGGSATAVVVVDPSGAAPHGDLPATWQAVAADVDLLWWRLPADPGDATAEAARAIRAHRRVYLVGAGAAALRTLTLAVVHPERVQAVILVDPPWPHDELAAVRALVARRVGEVHQFTTVASAPGPATLPLGHPDVLGQVMNIVTLGEPAASSPRLPARESLARATWSALRGTVRRLRPGPVAN